MLADEPGATMLRLTTGALVLWAPLNAGDWKAVAALADKRTKTDVVTENFMVKTRRIVEGNCELCRGMTLVVTYIGVDRHAAQPVSTGNVKNGFGRCHSRLIPFVHAIHRERKRYLPGMTASEPVFDIPGRYRLCPSAALRRYIS